MRGGTGCVCFADHVEVSAREEQSEAVAGEYPGLTNPCHAVDLIDLPWLVNDTQVIFLYGSDRKLSCKAKVSSSEALKADRKRTISVASTRVPTILSRILVFFSIICKAGSSLYNAASENTGVHLFIRCKRCWIRVGIKSHVWVNELKENLSS
jgi:hypothetical protein